MKFSIWTCSGFPKIDGCLGPRRISMFALKLDANEQDVINKFIAYTSKIENKSYDAAQIEEILFRGFVVIEKESN